MIPNKSFQWKNLLLLNLKAAERVTRRSIVLTRCLFFKIKLKLKGHYFCTVEKIIWYKGHPWSVLKPRVCVYSVQNWFKFPPARQM